MTDEDIAEFLNSRISELNKELSEESVSIIQRLENYEDVSEDDCHKLLSECLGVSKSDLRLRYRNIKEGL